MTMKTLYQLLFITTGLLHVTYGWDDKYDSDNDQNVLTIFLPLLAVAILACAAGCCYMEKRRKKKFKKKQEELSDDEISDTESCISQSSRSRMSQSSNQRPYLLPTETTGRTNSINYGSTRSLNSQQSYKSESRYLGNHTRNDYVRSRDRIASNDRRPENFSYYNDAMTRSTSMQDIRGNYTEDQDPMRRDRGAMRRSYSAMDLNMDQMPYPNRPPSAAKSDWSVRTEPAPPVRYYGSEMNYGSREPPTPLFKRSMSQPDLRRAAVNKTRTYPQGILKRSNSSRELSAHNQSDYFEDSASSGRGTMQSDRMTEPVGGRPRSRPPSVFSGNGSVRGDSRSNSIYGNGSVRSDRTSSRYGTAQDQHQHPQQYQQQQHFPAAAGKNGMMTYPGMRMNRRHQPPQQAYEDPYSAGYPPPYTQYRVEDEHYKTSTPPHHDPYSFNYDPYSYQQFSPNHHKFHNNSSQAQYYCY